MSNITYAVETYHADSGATERVEKEVILEPMPQAPEGYVAEDWVEDTGSQLIRRWNVVPAQPTDDEADLAEAARILLGVSE